MSYRTTSGDPRVVSFKVLGLPREYQQPLCNNPFQKSALTHFLSFSISMLGFPLQILLQSLEQFCFIKIFFLGCRHSLVDSSLPTILSPRVRVPSTPSTPFFIYNIKVPKYFTDSII